nr:hypothetical protein [Actinomycetota bacterium]
MRGNAYLFRDFKGGVNAQAAPYNLQDGEARDVTRNVVSTQRGAVRKRDGVVTFATPPEALNSLFALTSPNFLIGAGGTSLYRIDSSGMSAVLASTLTANLRWEFVQAPAQGGQGPLYGMNGTDTPKQWTGLTAASAVDWTSTSGALPNGKYLAYHGNRVFVAGVTAQPTRLYWSDIGNPRVWPVENVLDLDPGDGEPITGIGTLKGQLLVFKGSKAWTIFDLNTGANRRLGDNVGCVSHRSIVETTRGCYFLTRTQGIMVTDGY